MSLLRHVHGIVSTQVFDPTEEPDVVARLETVLRALQTGDSVAIRETQGGMLNFVLTTVSGVKGPRLYTEKPGHMGSSGWYAKSGRSTRFPTGQSALVEATPAVREFIQTYPIGTSRFITRHHPNWDALRAL